MSSYATIKVFDLSDAPPSLTQSEEFSYLFPNQDVSELMMLALTVGQLTIAAEAPEKYSVRKLKSAEAKLHKWLAEQGAIEGENVLIQRKPSHA